MFRWLMAYLHLIAFGLGLGAVWVRGRALRGAPTREAIGRALHADAVWGLAAVLWLGTGLVRAFGGLEKGTPYYLQNVLFLTKMALFLLILGLEIRPIVTLGGWRARLRRGQEIDTRAARRMAHTSFVQAGILILMVFLATGMARGYGFR